MTVSSQTPINRSSGNGVTTVFPYTFKIISASDIEVSVDDVVKILNVDYTVSGAGVDAGGNVTMTTAPATGTTVVRRRNMVLVRSTDYQDQGSLPAAQGWGCYLLFALFFGSGAGFGTSSATQKTPP